MKIYTKTGDKGQTGLQGGARVSKDHPRVCAYGDVDELNSSIGAALSILPTRRIFAGLRRDLRTVQNDLFAIGAELSKPDGGKEGVEFGGDAAQYLERAIDRMSAELPALKNFILPGGSECGATLHVARCVCRRAERSTVALGKGKVDAEIILYLNRLSDTLFTAARWINFKLKKPETAWRAAVRAE